MFHVKSGLFFQRTEDGGVRIIKTSDDLAIRPDNVIMDITIDECEFASVMASVSALGETKTTWNAALDFLNPPYPGDEEAVRRSGLSVPFCSCAGRVSDDPHKDRCPLLVFVLGVRKSWPGRH